MTIHPEELTTLEVLLHCVIQGYTNPVRLPINNLIGYFVIKVFIFCKFKFLHVIEHVSLTS